MVNEETRRFDSIREKTAEVVAKAESLYGVKLNPLSTSFNLRGRVAGWASCKACRTGQGKTFGLRFNRNLILGDKHYQDILDETVPHEVAHLVCYADPSLGKNHDRGWKRVCIAIGGNGKTRHEYDTKIQGSGWDYMTDLGHRVTVNAKTHRRIQESGRVFRYRNGKGAISKLSPFCKEGGEMPESPPTGNIIPSKPLLVDRDTRKAEALKTMQNFKENDDSGESDTLDWLRWAESVMSAEVVDDGSKNDHPIVRRSDGSMSKAALVRSMIRTAKENGLPVEDVIRQAISELGMSRGQATNYVMQNWRKV
jgi:predicted SprT family Zn-dependent metalloprotease